MVQFVLRGKTSKPHLMARKASHVFGLGGGIDLLGVAAAPTRSLLCRFSAASRLRTTPAASQRLYGWYEHRKTHSNTLP